MVSHSDGISSPQDLVPFLRFSCGLLWRNQLFRGKKSSLLPLFTERTNARLQSLSIFTTPLCKRSKMLQKHHLSELAVRTTSQGWISTSGQVSRSPCKLSNHCLEQLWYIVTTCLFTLPDASACSQYATGWRSHLRYRPQWDQAHHPALSFGSAEPWDLLNQTCSEVWPHYARKRHLKNK